eukprot:scaffold103504_cov55-Attheya_sp.AAC.1
MTFPAVRSLSLAFICINSLIVSVDAASFVLGNAASTNGHYFNNNSHLTQRSISSYTSHQLQRGDDTPECESDSPARKRTSRREVVISVVGSTLGAAVAGLVAPVDPVWAATRKCSDIESCREIGDRKIAEDMVLNPMIKLANGVRYKVMKPPLVKKSDKDQSASAVKMGSLVDVIYSVSLPGAGYLNSKGMGFEKISSGQNDLGLDSLRVVVGKRDVPQGIEEALIGMQRGERRRVELPPAVGFETSDWRPSPENKQAENRLLGYRRILEGNGPSQPPFAAVTVWDIEVLKVRNS